MACSISNCAKSELEGAAPCIALELRAKSQELRARLPTTAQVMQAYGFDVKMTEAECVGELMNLYQRLASSS